MTTLVDIIAAALIGAVLILVSANAMNNALQVFVNNNADAITQTNLTTTTAIIQQDLRKMGYGIKESQQGSIIQIAEPDKVSFLTLLNNDDAIPDTITYNIVPFDSIALIDTMLVLCNIKKLVKLSNGSTDVTYLGSISNSAAFRYLDQIGRPTAIKSSIKMVEVTLIEVNPEVYLSDEFLAAENPGERIIEARKLMRESFWRQTRVISKNLRR